MNNLIERADTDREQASLVAFLSGHLSSHVDVSRFQWLYCNSPHGKALVWILRDPSTGDIKGLSAAFPRRVYAQGREAQAYVLGDFCIHPDSRSLGPALALQKRMLEDLASLGEGFVYDFPSRSMVAIYKRLGVTVSQEVVRTAKLLLTEGKLQQWVGNKWAAKALAAVPNRALHLRDNISSHAHSWTIAVHNEFCGDEFTEAAQQWSAPVRNCAARTAEHLNWRFLQHPGKRYRLLTARTSAHRLCGYLVYEIAADQAILADTLAEGEAVTEAMLYETFRELRQCGISTLSAPVVRGNSQLAVLSAHDFLERETSPLVTLRLLDGRYHNSPASDWYLTDGDRES